MLQTVSSCQAASHRFSVSNLDVSLSSFSNALLPDSVGAWNATLVGGVKYSATTRAMEFNGVDGHLSLGAHGLGGALSVAIWIRVDALTHWSKLWDFGAGAPGSNVFLSISPVSNGNNVAMLGFYSAARADTYLLASDVWKLHTWTFVVGTYTASGGLALYIDGQQVASLPPPATGGIPAGVRNMFIGRSLWSGDSYFNGAVADVQLFNAALGADDVASLYAGRGCASPPPLPPPPPSPQPQATVAANGTWCTNPSTRTCRKNR